MGFETGAKNAVSRRLFIGGSDARIIMSPDEAALIRLWKEKRGEVELEKLAGNLIVQLGVATEALNRSWYQRNTGRSVTDVQRWVQHPVKRWMAATLDGFVNELDAVFQAKFMLPWSFYEEAAAQKHPASTQHVGDQRQIGGRLNHNRRRQMGRDDHSPGTRSASIFWSPPRSGSGVRPIQGDSPALWHRAASAADRGGAYGRHGRVQLLG